MAFSEGNQLFAGDFRANMDETNTDMVQFTNRWNWKLIFQHKEEYFHRNLTAKNATLHQSMSISKSGCADLSS